MVNFRELYRTLLRDLFIPFLLRLVRGTGRGTNPKTIKVEEQIATVDTVSVLNIAPMTISQLITKHAPSLAPLPSTLNAEAVLWAVYHCEKYTPAYPNPRFEPSYAPGGYYHDTSQRVRDAYAEYGRDAACSYSNFQILYIVALELGYAGPPRALDKDSFALPFVVKYINGRCLERGADTPEEVADAYNSLVLIPTLINQKST